MIDVSINKNGKNEGRRASLKLGSELADRTESRVLDMDFTCIEVFFNATFL